MRHHPRLDQIYVGDALAILKRWPEDLVDLVLTSPPYYQLRDYGVAGQLGLEEAPAAYVAKLLAVMRQIRRVLKPSGSVFLNLGDTYQRKTLLGIPWRVALAMLEEGWLLRNAIIWHKPNALPRPFTDRLTTTYEFVFHFVKRERYSYDLDAIRVPHKGTYREGTATKRFARQSRFPHLPGLPVAGNFRPHPKGKNPGDVWSIPSETRPKDLIAPGGISHFAPYPEALCERPILAACPPGGVVLDPFLGSGTTAVVARRLGRHFLGIELSAEYAALAERRLAAAAPPPTRPRRPSIPRQCRRTPIARICTRNGPIRELTFSSHTEGGHDYGFTHTHE